MKKGEGRKVLALFVCDHVRRLAQRPCFRSYGSPSCRTRRTDRPLSGGSPRAAPPQRYNDVRSVSSRSPWRRGRCWRHAQLARQASEDLV